MKKIFVWVIVIVVIIFGIYKLTKKENTETTFESTTPNQVETNPTSAQHEQINPQAQGNQQTPPNTQSTIYTAAQVATHSSAASCWTIVNKGVYDLTNWINKHPGGKQAIVGTCGKDASVQFNEQHGGQGGPEKILASFKIGILG